MDGPATTPPTIQPVEVRAWLDPVVEAHGFGPHSAYVEYCLLPVVGPTAAWLYRRLGMLAERWPAGIQVDLVELSLSLGLGAGCGRHSVVVRTLGRLAHFEIVQWGAAELLVRRAVAPLTERQLARLPASVRHAHVRLVRREAGDGPAG